MSREVTGTLLTIGDEILLGDISNGNAHYIASELRSRGFRLDKMITIGDREDEIVENLGKCLEGSRFIIVTGGLGPTDDDRTCAAVSRAFNRPLSTNINYTKWLQERLASFGLEWSEYVARMAQLPEGAVKLGLEMAGFFIEHSSTPCYFLPGVPHEMRILLKEAVIPDLEVRFPDRLIYVKHVIRVQGLVESELNERLQDLTAERIGVDIGYLPQVAENWVTLFAAAEDDEKVMLLIRNAETKIISRLGAEHISGHNEECLEMVIGQQLRKRGWKLAVAESCTGGLLSRKVTAIAGASDYFDRGFITYSNQAKMDILKVEEELLKNHGAVSEPVALAMVEGARREAEAEVAVAITGIAGPSGGSPEKPVGTVFIACATPRDRVARKFVFSGSREHIQENAAQAALAILWRVLSDDPYVHCH
jgi:nicotinamide-nucleotide amidase